MKPLRFKKIAIIGVGLLGGSVALAAKKKGLAKEIWGFSKHSERTAKALKQGLITQAGRDLTATVAGADLVVMASPFTQFESLLKTIAKTAPTDCLVTDLGSVKGAWVGRWEAAARPLRFVGCHPMAGSEKTGFEWASAQLFEGAPCILTPSARTDRGALKTVTAFWKALGGKILFRDPAEHDRVIGVFSHLTHAASFALAASAAGAMKKKDFALAGPSFRGAIRIAASDPGLWSDIFKYNRAQIEMGLDAYSRELKSLRVRLRPGKEKALAAWLAKVSKLAQRELS